MRKVVGSMPEFHDWRPVGDRLRLSLMNHSNNTQKVIRGLEKELKREKADIQILRTAKKTMEDVFTHAVQQRRDS